MTTYLIVFAAIVPISIITFVFRRRSPRLSGPAAKPSADALLRELYSQYWVQVTALTQVRMLDAPSDEQWLAEIRKRAFASADSQQLSGSLPAAFQDSRDAVRHGPGLQRATGFLPAFTSAYARLRCQCGNVLRRKGVPVTTAAAVVILVVCTPAAVGARSVPANLRRATIPASYSIQFSPGQFTLSGADRDTLDGLVNAIEQSSARVTITGYADGLDTVAADRRLALQRAQAVAAFLQTRGISTSRLLVQGVRLHVPGLASRSVTIFIWEHSGNG
jgi:outer membrane protein OmpA-like peptidoglycan-associated protein